MKAISVALLGGVLVSAVAEEVVTPPETPPADAGLEMIDLPPPLGPVTTPSAGSHVLALPPPPRKPVEIAVAPVVKRTIRSSSPAPEPDSDGSYGGFNDVRFAWTGGASSFTLTDDNTSVASVDGDFDSTGRITIEWIGSPGMSKSGGMMLGVVGAYQWNDGKLPTGEDLSVTSWVIDLEFGYGIPIGRNFELEFVPFLGLGGISGTLDSSLGVGSYSGFIFEWGLCLNGVYTFDSGFQMGLTGRFLGFSGTLQDSSSYSVPSYTLGATGVVGGALVGVRF